MSEPKGDCPFCDARKWHVCKHFVGYVCGDKIVNDSGNGRKGRRSLRPKRADEVAVDTGVSVRAYRRTA